VDGATGNAPGEAAGAREVEGGLMALRWKYETWRKLYVREQGSFAQLPLMARSLAKQLLCYVDDDGRIALGGREPVEAIIYRAGGADLADRRALKKYVPMLLADGYLVRDGDALRIRNFGHAQHGTDKIQVHQGDATATSADRDRDSTRELSAESPVASPNDDLDRDSTATRPRLDRDSTATRADHERDTTTESKQENCSGSLRSSFLPDLPSDQRERERAARQVLGDSVWSSHRALRERLHRELELPGKLLPLHEQDPGRRELAERIRERGDDLDAAREALGHVLDFREQEARSNRTLADLDGSIWTARRMAKVVAMSIADASAPQRTRRATPASHTPETIAAAREVLAKITERTGADYANEPEALQLVAGRLASGDSAYDLRTVIAYCWEPDGRGWGDDPKMRQHLTPSTLFGAAGWAKNWPPAKAWRDAMQKPPKRAEPDERSPDWIRPVADGGRR
jgi:hypothetical protein